MRRPCSLGCVLFAILLLAVPALGQAPPTKTPPLGAGYLRDLAQTRRFQFGRPVRPQPTPDGKSVLFLRSRPRSGRLSLFAFDVAAGSTRELLTPEAVLKGAVEKLSPEEKAQRERMRVSAGGFTSYQLSKDGSLILLGLSGKLYLVRRDSGNVQELKTGSGPLLNPTFAPDGAKIAYVRGHDLYVLVLATQKETRLTTGGSAEVSHGTAEFVAQEEMARFAGFWWAPDSLALAYQETDNRGVEVWYVADPSAPGRKPTPFFYPRPGKANAKVRVGVVPVTGGSTTWLAWDTAKYPYLATFRWSSQAPPSLTVQTRDQKEVALLRADTKTGKTTPILTERSDTWVNLHQEAPYWLPEERGFLWVSERHEGPELQWRSPTGRLRRVLVGPDLGYRGLVSVDAQGRQAIFTASADPTQLQLYRIDLLDAFAEPVALTKEPGLHTAVFNRAHTLWVQTDQSLDAMPRSVVRRGDGKPAGTLPSVAEEPPARPVVTLLKVGKQKLNAAVVWPHDFDARKKYPVMVDVYGGPHHLHVVASEGRWLLDQWYADQGFIVVSIDGRGTPGRGTAWERAIYKSFGTVPLADQVEGLQALGAKYPAMDLQRVGIDGWSFGGYLAALAVLRRPDVYRAAVAGAPVADWYDYDTHYTERYLGVPPAADQAYRDASLLTYAAGLRRPLLILHGTADDNVYFRHSLRLGRALFLHGKEFEMLPLSGLTHMVPDPQVMERLHTRIAHFFHRHLGRPE